MAASAAVVTFSIPCAADDSRAGELLQELQKAEPEQADRIARELRLEWSKSGSPAMDLLLKRGRDAIERGDMDEAVEHLTALTDHAPGFAEGWVNRAMVFFRQEQLGLALNDLEHALALNPQHFGAIQGLGAIFEMLGDKQQAYAAYRQALAINPHDEDVQEAIERLDTAVRGTNL